MLLACIWVFIWSCGQIKGTFEFTRNSVGDGVFDFYVNHFFVVCMTNLLLEGQFNLVDEYTDANHDELLRECIIQYLNWTLVKERKSNCNSEMRTQPASCGKALDTAHKSKRQTQHYGEKASEGASRHSTAEMNSAMARYDARLAARLTSRQSAATTKGDISDDNCRGCGIHCEEAALFCCDHLGCVVAMCKACTGWSDDRLEGHYYCADHENAHT